MVQTSAVINFFYVSFLIISVPKYGFIIFLYSVTENFCYFISYKNETGNLDTQFVHLATQAFMDFLLR